MEKNHDTAKDGESKKEDTKGSSEEINSKKGCIAEIKVKDGMTEMGGMFIAIAKLDPSSNKREDEASQAMAHKQIYDVDAPGPILLDSAGQLFKLTTFTFPPMLTILLLETMRSQLSFRKSWKAFMNSLVLMRFSRKILRLVTPDMPCKLHLKRNQKMLAMGRLIFIVAAIGTKIFNLHH